MAYATVTDLEAGWRVLTAEEKTRAATLLDRASVIIDAQANTEALTADVLKIVSTSMVQRVMASNSNSGIKQESMGAGSYTQSWTYENPSGNLYLTKAERKLLGIGNSWASGSVKVAIHDPDGVQIDW